MSTSLIVFIPLVLLGLVGTLCFVGCGLVWNYGGYRYQSTYEHNIANAPDIVAFWPLNDPSGPLDPIPTAADVAVHPPPAFDGEYTDSGVGLRTKPGIVPGDVESDNTPMPCADFGAGRVEVPFHAELNAAPFTLECWVQPTWPASDTNIHVVVATSNQDPTANSGYSLFCDNNNFWNASIGLGPGATPPFIETTPAASSQPVVPGPNPSTNQVFYLALSFDGVASLNLFVAPFGQPFNMTPYATATVPMGQTFAPSSGMLKFFIGMGRPDMPPGQFPFVGKIQDVALYKSPADPNVLMAHFNMGGTAPPVQQGT